MSVQPTTPAPVAPAPVPTAPEPTEPVATAPEAPTAPDPSKASPWDDPSTAKAEIERLRRENGAARTTAKQQAADEARADLAQTIGKALGLVQNDEPVDPAELTKQVSTSQADAKAARVELAVFKNAATAGADPLALLDSASFLAKAASLDPTDVAGLTAAMQEAVTANPRLGAAPATRTPAPNPAQGSSASGPSGTPQLSKEQLATMSPADIDKAFREGRLADVLGSK